MTLRSPVAEPRYRHLIILITGYPDGNILEKGRGGGIHHVLLKPHLEESLVSRIRGAIQGVHPVSR